MKCLKCKHKWERKKFSDYVSFFAKCPKCGSRTVLRYGDFKESLIIILIIVIALFAFNSYYNKDKSVACTEEAKLCPDGSAVGRTGSNCEFEKCPGEDGDKIKIYCKKEQRNADGCIEIYQPVCGWSNENIKCLKYPCASTYSNYCFACVNEDVEYYTSGECPK